VESDRYPAIGWKMTINQKPPGGAVFGWQDGGIATVIGAKKGTAEGGPKRGRLRI